MDEESLEELLKELFPDREIRRFSLDWMLKCPATEESVHELYAFLTGKGLDNETIATHAHFLVFDPEVLDGHYQHLLDMGLTKKKIVSHATLLMFSPEVLDSHYQSLLDLGLRDNTIVSQAQLLLRNPKVIEENFQFLLDLGLTSKKIASHAQLLGMKPETIEQNYQFLRDLGLTDKKIASQGELLGRNPRTMKRNYRRLSDLGLTDKKIASKARLLGRSPKTLKGRYQFLHDLGLTDETISSRPELLEYEQEIVSRNAEIFDQLDIEINAAAGGLCLSRKFFERLYLFHTEDIPLDRVRMVWDHATYKLKAKIDYLHKNAKDLAQRDPNTLVRSLDSMMLKYGSESNDLADVSATEVNEDYKQRFEEFYDDRGGELKEIYKRTRDITLAFEELAQAVA